MKRTTFLVLFFIARCAAAQIPDFTSTTINFPGQAASEAVDPAGNLWIADPSHKALGRLELPSQNYTSYLIPASENVGLYNIATTPDGAVWYADYNNPIIGRRTPDGNISQFPVPSAPYLIAGSSDDGVFFYPGGPSALGYLTVAGGIPTVTSLPLPAGTFIQSLTVGHDGAAYFVDLQSNHRIGRVDLGGHVTFFAATQPNPPSSLQWYPSITPGPDGNIWFTHATFIGRVRLSDGVVTEFPIPYAKADAGGICTGGDGNIWFADSYAGAGVVSQLVLSTATDDGHATINASPGVGEPIGIIALMPLANPQLASAPPAIATQGESHNSQTNTPNPCSSFAFVAEQNFSSGANLTSVVIAKLTGACADIRFLPTTFIAEGSAFLIQFEIFNAGPDDAAPPEFQANNVVGISDITVAGGLSNWNCSNDTATVVRCLRSSPLTAGSLDSGTLSFLARGPDNSVSPYFEFNAYVFSVTDDPIIFNNLFSFGFATGNPRRFLTLRKIPTNNLRSVVGRP